MTSRMRAFMEESISAPIRTQARCWGPALAITSTITSSGRSMTGIVTTDKSPRPKRKRMDTNSTKKNSARTTAAMGGGSGE